MFGRPITAELRDDGRISVDADIVEQDAILQVSGVRLLDNVFTVPGSWGACLALRGIFGDRLVVGPRLTAWSIEQRDQRVQPSLALRTATEPPEGVSYDPRLRPFQTAGVHWMLTAGDCLLGDDLGAGKTVQTAVALREQGFSCGLVAAPLSVLHSWRKHLEEWAGMTAIVVDGTPAVRRKKLARVAAGEFQVAIMTWEAVRQHSKLAGFGSIELSEKERQRKELDELPLEFVVLDEAQRMRSPKNKVTRACWNLADKPSVRWRVALTGTPVGNALDELWSIMRFVHPQEWPDKTRWVERYCEQTWNRWGGREIGGIAPAHQDEFFGTFDPRYRAMPKSIVLPHLPPIRGGVSDPAGHQLRPCEMPKKQKDAYEQLVQHQVAELDSGLLVAADPLSLLTRQLQFASAYGELEDYTDEEGRPLQRIVLTRPSSKLDALAELMDGELDSEEAVVVFVQSRQLAALAGEDLEKYGAVDYIMGGQTSDERERAIEEFQAGRRRFLVVTMKSGGAGVTLTRARVAVYLEHTHSYIDRFQSEGRIHRIGSEHHESVLYLDVVSQGTCELAVLDVLRRKEELDQSLKRHEALRELLTSRGTIG
jgi:SNF2 family DNA or RNA helicase